MVETVLNTELHSDTFSIPKWLDNKFFEEHLQNYYKNDEIEVISYDRKPATGKGENYSSVIYRVNVLFSAPSKMISSRERDVSEILIFNCFLF